MGKETLITAKKLEDYFFTQVQSAFQNQKVQTNPHTQYYLVHLLSSFCLPKALYPSQEVKEKPLAIQYLESLQMSRAQRFKTLKYLGDFTLFIAGFFQESLNRQNVDLNYYIALGGNSYQRLHRLSQPGSLTETQREIFLELAHKFLKFVDVLSEISENTNICRNSDLLRLYEKYTSTGSERILKKLQEFGIHPLKETPTEIN